jgi:hypothetical protein
MVLADESGQIAFSAVPAIVVLSLIPRSFRPAEEDDCKSSTPGCCGFATVMMGERLSDPTSLALSFLQRITLAGG